MNEIFFTYLSNLQVFDSQLASFFIFLIKMKLSYKWTSQFLQSKIDSQENKWILWDQKL